MNDKVKKATSENIFLLTCNILAIKEGILFNKDCPLKNARATVKQPSKTIKNRSSVMSVESHIESLQSKHAMLEAALSEEIARPNPDFYAVKDIKKQKLIIKEEIARLTHDIKISHQNAS